MPSRPLTKLQEEFAAWLLTSKRERQLYALPTTQAQWAEWKGVAPKTVQRWKNGNQQFQEYLEQLRIRKAQQVTPNSTTTAEDVGGARAASDARTRRRLQPPAAASAEDDHLNAVADPRHRDYLTAREALMAGVVNGDRAYIETYLKLYGREFIEAEQAGAERLVDLTDDQLAVELVDLLGPDRVAEVLASRVAAE